MILRTAASIGALLLLVLPAHAVQSGRVRRVNPPPAEPAATPAPQPAQPAAPPRAAPQAVTAKFDAKYAGGSLPIDFDDKVTIAFKDGRITITSKATKVEVEASDVTDASYGQRVRQRTAEGVGVGSVIPGLGGIIGNTKSTSHYVEIVWGGAPSQGIAMRVDKGDYENMINAIEWSTGLKVRRDNAPPIKDIP